MSATRVMESGGRCRNDMSRSKNRSFLRYNELNRNKRGDAMTSVTFDEVLTLAQQLKPADQARLVEHLAPVVRREWEPLPPSLEALIVPPQGTPEDAIALLRSWVDVDEEGTNEQRETWNYLKQALDEDRLSYRRHFPEEAAEQ